MCYLVTGVNGARADAGGRLHSLWDTEDEAKLEAERCLKLGYNEIALWKQIATPKLEQTVSWG